MNEPPIGVNGNGTGGAPEEPANTPGNSQNSEQRFLQFFGLNEQPFGVTPDPRFLYLGPEHRQALAALKYGTESNRGFLTLIAPPGMGKTSLLFSYLEGLRDAARTVFLFQTDGDPRELMSYILADLGLPCAGKDLPEMHSQLNQVLMDEMRAGRRFVLVIDEAQNLTEKVLESVRLLSNFETPWVKLMQIVLAGQPQLARRLAKPSMAQLKQRVSFSIRIQPLSKEEVGAYVDHRLWVAGYKGQSLFSSSARALLAEHSEGIPRNINNICFCAMSLGWATQRNTVDGSMMRDVLSELSLAPVKAQAEPRPKPAGPPKISVKPTVPPRLSPVLTVSSPPVRSWLPKMFFAIAVLAALGWSGLHLDLGRRFKDLWHTISGAESSTIVPAASPVSDNPAITSDPGNSSPGPTDESPTDGKTPEASRQSRERSVL
jgi:type II secretory pathway predicted ATPase ExeA